MRSTWIWIAWAALGAFAVSGCDREKREFRVHPGSAEPTREKQLTSVEVGGSGPLPKASTSYEQNAYSLSQGQQLYTNFNCIGCHAYGGGDIGPALLDDKWIYGSEPSQIYASIVEGRPNGMPAFGSRIAGNQVWQIVAYVRSMSGLASKSAAPGRDDHMKTAQPPNSVEKEKPTHVSEFAPR